MGAKPSAVLCSHSGVMDQVFPAPLREQIQGEVNLLAELRREDPQTPAAWPAETEVIFSSWGMPTLDGATLEAMPQLQAVFYGAGSVKGFVTPESWARGIRIFSAAAGNAVPVAEFTVGMILLSLKRVHQLRLTRPEDWPLTDALKDAIVGNYRTRIGLVSYGTIARLVRDKLRPFDHEICVCDPFLSEAEAAVNGINLLSLEDLFRECEVVSLHAPLLPETTGIIRGEHFQSMPPGAVFINTARGAIVRQREMLAALKARPDLHAVLDVVDPEPPESGEPLFALPNVEIYPHIAGSMGRERARMGAMAFEAFKAFRAGEPSPLEVRESDLALMA